MAITITENAADRVKTFLGNRGKGVGLRVGVKTTLSPKLACHWFWASFLVSFLMQK